MLVTLPQEVAGGYPKRKLSYTSCDSLPSLVRPHEALIGVGWKAGVVLLLCVFCVPTLCMERKSILHGKLNTVGHMTLLKIICGIDAFLCTLLVVPRCKW